jgi:D-sedoheptulose 7-phosphate isomerase
MANIAESTVKVPSHDTARIQEGHILCGHMLCDWIELSVCAQEHSEIQATRR